MRREAARVEYERERLECASMQAPAQTGPPPGDGPPPPEPDVTYAEPPEDIT